MLSDKPLCCPLHAIPASYEDSSPDVFIQQEGNPHTTDAPFQRNTEDVSQPDGNAPLNHQSDVKRVVDVAGCTQSVRGKNIDRSSDFENNVNDEDGGTQPDDLFVGGQPVEMVFPKTARTVESMTVIITDFFITYFPIRKAA